MRARRVELPEGEWIELHERMTHAEQRRIWHAVAEGDTLESFQETVAALAIAWDLHDDDGRPIPFPPDRPPEGIPSSALDVVPASAILIAGRVGAEIFAGRADPNDSAASSTDSPGA